MNTGNLEVASNLMPTIAAHCAVNKVMVSFQAISGP
jgi:hypothetical protein